MASPPSPSRAAADIAEQPDVLAGIGGHNAEALARAHEVVVSHEVCRLAGIGSSRHAAGYGSRVLELVAGRVTTVLPTPGAGIAQLRSPHPLVVVSQSGQTPALLDLASSQDGDVIAVTNDPSSPLARAAAVSLDCGAGAERVIAATKSVTAQMLLLRLLAGPVDVTPLVDAVRAALDLDVTPAVDGDPPRSVVCAGVGAEWVGAEIALKLAEMAGRVATSGDVVAHFHGRTAAHPTVLAFLDPDDPNAVELADQPGVVSVGPDAAFDLETPSTGDPTLDPIVTTVVGQRVVLAWAHALGEDPDAPRGLSKVTRTQ